MALLLSLLVLTVVGGFSLLVNDLRNHPGCMLTGGICIGLMTILVFSHPPMPMTYDYQYSIYALEDNLTYHRDRIGGAPTYYREQDTRYYYMAGYKDGKKMYWVDKNEAYIVEDKNSYPHIEVYKEKPQSKYPIINWLWSDMSNRTEYKIVVPEQTISTGFNVDLK